MHVEMKNGLPGLFPIVKDKAKVLNTLFFGYLTPHPHQFAEKLFVPGLKSRRGADMFFGNYQEMDWCLGRNIPKGEKIIVFIQGIRRNFTANNFTEQAVFGHGHKKNS